jgi:elongation factor 1-gamma
VARDAIKFFWENLDRAGFSVYFADYKDNPIKGNRFFMTCNLVGGAFQRLEEVRKYAFGSYCIFGADGENEIHGVWVFRGNDIPREVRESPDFESYDFTPANLDDATHRHRINAFLAWKEIDGVASFAGVTKLPFGEGKVFK